MLLLVRRGAAAEGPRRLPAPRASFRPVPGPRIGVIGAGGVGVATVSALIMRGLAGRLTIYSRDAAAAQGLALDFLHASPLLPRMEIHGRGLDQIDEEDMLVLTAGQKTAPGGTRL